MQKYIAVLDSEALATVPDLRLAKHFESDTSFIPSEGHTLEMELFDGSHEFVLMANSYAYNYGLCVFAYEEIDDEVSPGILPMEEWDVTTCLTGFPGELTAAFVETEHPFMPYFLEHPELFDVSDQVVSRDWKQYRRVDFAEAFEAGLLREEEDLP